MTQMEIEKLLEISIALSSEKNYSKLLEQILADVMTLTHCDAGVLYLKEENALCFKIMRNNTLKHYQGGSGELLKPRPVPLEPQYICARALLDERTIEVSDVTNCIDYDFTDLKQYDAVTGYHTRSLMVVPMTGRQGVAIGVIELINPQDERGNPEIFRKDTIRAVEAVASLATIAITNMNSVEAVRELFYSFIQVLSAAIDARIPYNATHTKNMVRYGEVFLDYLNEKCCEKGLDICVTPEHREEIIMSIWLHDIGKLVIPLGVMNKSTRLGDELPLILRRLDVITLRDKIRVLEGQISEEEGRKCSAEVEAACQSIQSANTGSCLDDELMHEIRRLGERTYVDVDGQEKHWLTPEETECLTICKGTLTEEERGIMESHATVTRQLLSQILFPVEYEHVPFWASGHHEYLDGTGYPDQLKGEELPFEIRLITILDIFEALTAADRPYKTEIPVHQALEVLKTMAVKEGKLDAVLTDAFIASRCWEPFQNN